MKQTFRGGRVISLKRVRRRWVVVGRNGTAAAYGQFALALAAAWSEVADG